MWLCNRCVKLWLKILSHLEKNYRKPRGGGYICLDSHCTWIVLNAAGANSSIIICKGFFTCASAPVRTHWIKLDCAENSHDQRFMSYTNVLYLSAVKNLDILVFAHIGWLLPACHCRVILGSSTGMSELGVLVLIGSCMVTKFRFSYVSSLRLHNLLDSNS